MVLVGYFLYFQGFVIQLGTDKYILMSVRKTKRNMDVHQVTTYLLIYESFCLNGGDGWIHDGVLILQQKVGENPTPACALIK